MRSAGSELRRAWSERPIMVPGAFNALTAQMAERLGFEAVYLSGGALSAGWAGVPDIGLLGLSEFVAQASILVRATRLPVISDADTGFGDVVNVEQTVRLFEQVGVAGIHIEDQVLPKRCGHLSGKALVKPSQMVEKVRAAVASRSDPHFVVIARTDARSVEGFDAAVDRALAYIDAGADMIFPEALESADEFERFARRVPVPLMANMTEFGRSPLLPFDTLALLGYRAVLYPLTAFRAAMKAAEATLRGLREAGTQVPLLSQFQTRAELYDLIGYRDWEARDRLYFSRDIPPDEPEPPPRPTPND
ncbi:MAG: methylisocitrate lyase [Isosphaeraceae bacterium]